MKTVLFSTFCINHKENTGSGTSPIGFLAIISIERVLQAFGRIGPRVASTAPFAKTPGQCCLSKTGRALRGIFWAHRAQRTAIMVENFGLRRRVPGGVDMRSKAKGASRKASATKGDKGRQRVTSNVTCGKDGKECQIN